MRGACYFPPSRRGGRKETEERKDAGGAYVGGRMQLGGQQKSCIGRKDETKRSKSNQMMSLTFSLRNCEPCVCGILSNLLVWSAGAGGKGGKRGRGREGGVGRLDSLPRSSINAMTDRPALPSSSSSSSPWLSSLEWRCAWHCKWCVEWGRGLSEIVQFLILHNSFFFERGCNPPPLDSHTLYHKHDPIHSPHVHTSQEGKAPPLLVPWSSSRAPREQQ
jgi:hypothetical protein